jgi:malonyl-CoA/methylmalonyl-CoA synthetase
VLVNTQYRHTELRHIFADSEARLTIVDAHVLGELRRVAPEVPALQLAVSVGADPDQAGLDSAPRQVGEPPDGGLRIVEEAVFLGTSPPAPLPRGEGDASGVSAPGGGGQASAVEVPPGGEQALPEAGDVALLAYTSGTTGRPKGAMLTHGNLGANSAALTRAWGWTERDRLLLALPLFHIHGLGVGLHGALYTGSTIELRRRFDAKDVFDTLRRGQATMFFGVPTMYTRLIAETERRAPEVPPPIRLYVSGSAPLSVQAHARFEQLFGQRILERYGMTETVMNLTNPLDGERRPGTVGMPFPGQEARIVDVRGRQPILDERPGEIQVRGPHVFTGYWRQPEATKAAFAEDGWFNTGDLGWRSADGYFTISGRARELIITGGYNVYPREVEEVLLTHPAVAEAAVLGQPDPDYGEQVVAAIVAKPGAALTAAEVVEHCRDQLASYKKPRHVFFVEALPRNALGKVQKHLIAEQVAAGSPPGLAPGLSPGLPPGAPR